tara:strand:- start:235 stop:354 length:120 start_codon:yes stop_codon:yes gene_type:complete
MGKPDCFHALSGLMISGGNVPGLVLFTNIAQSGTENYIK